MLVVCIIKYKSPGPFDSRLLPMQGYRQIQLHLLQKVIQVPQYRISLHHQAYMPLRRNNG
jgi:hypothetical protein